MATYSIFGIVFVVCVWLYSIYSILSNKFKNEEEKKIWLIAVIFMPIISLFYMFIKKDLIK